VLAPAPVEAVVGAYCAAFRPALSLVAENLALRVPSRAAMMDVEDATKEYEARLGEHTLLLGPDLELKHQQMAAAAFPFFRATFYRWFEVWQETCAELHDAPVVLSVGDLHVENFGTWRDSEGRLVWGVNDFDEAAPLPWTQDLVRLATSAHLAMDAARLSVGRNEVCTAILDGYREALSSGGRPFILAERHGWLRKIALGKLRNPVRFWEKLDALPTLSGSVPQVAESALRRGLPGAGPEWRIVHRIAGLGSLGRQRFAAIAEWNGGRVAREVKVLLPSVCLGVLPKGGECRTYYRAIIDAAVRAPDPCAVVLDEWIVRRLAPDCARVELADLPQDRDETRLLNAMGFETGNVHLGSRDLRHEILRDLARRPEDWLHQAARRLRKAVRKDWVNFRRRDASHASR
jgi:hypothetical protein